MPTITILTANREIHTQAPAGTLLSAVLQSELPSFALPCAGNHTCGKCRVQVSGQVSEPDAHELAFLSADDRTNGIRLACSCRISGDVTVTVHTAGPSKILAWNEIPTFTRTETGCGIAVDIGTTTVAMQLFDRASGTVLAEQLAENAQRSHGADVISRIEACKTAGLDTLSTLIRDQLEQMAQNCLTEAGISHIDEAVVTGNSTMLYLYEGIDPSALAVVPFTMSTFFGSTSRHTLAGAPVYLPRCIGAYVGADITCSILASDMLHEDGVQLMTDIGTNGEMALYKDGKLLCCATAAGPAFEGAGLSCGMPAAPGAIRTVELSDNQVTYTTVGDRPAVGICGSGILDALRVMLEQETIDDTGYLETEDEESYTIGNSTVSITQKDVRQIQLAKSAICAGLLTLMQESGITADEVARFHVAGGFGSSINYDSAAAIGLFPAALTHKTHFIGNGALGGAAMLLMNRELRTISERMAQDACELSLSASPVFMDAYVDCMSFMEF